MKRRTLVSLAAMLVVGVGAVFYVASRSPLNDDERLDESEQHYLLTRLENEVFADGRVDMNALKEFISSLPDANRVYTWNKAGYENTIPQLVMIAFHDRFSEQERLDFDKMIQCISEDSKEGAC